jgi:sporulation protein YlmC with PRC-barrel domain
MEKREMLSDRTKLMAASVAATMLMMVGFATVSRAESTDRKNRMESAQAENGGGHAWKASELIGLSVRTTGDEEKGKIKDLMISPTGRVEYAAVSFGGFMGFGDKLFAVPIDAIHLEWKDNKISHAKVDVTEESIKQRKGFDENHWPEQGDRGFITSSAGRNDNMRPVTH